MKALWNDPMFWHRFNFGLKWAMVSLGSGLFLVGLTPNVWGVHTWGSALVGLFTSNVVQPAVHAEFDRRHRDTPR